LVAPALAVIVLRAAPALAAEPLDLDLTRLGAPSAGVWSCLEAYRAGSTTCPSPDTSAIQASLDARHRFALLSSEMALALTNTLLEPASTTGMSGFDVSAEAGYAQVHADVIGQTGVGTGPTTYWPTHTLTPHELFVPSVHVRKALPFSFELGGRILYLSQSSYFGAQIEGRWALAESMTTVGLKLPDVAVRAARTQLYGQRDWRLGATEVDLVVSKRFGVNGVTSFTPYAGARFTFLDASTAVMDFGPARPPGTPPQQADTTQAAFPSLHATFYRTTVGVRMTSYLVSMAGEVTYGAGGTFGTGSPSPDEYPKYKVKSSLGGAFRFGFEF
jgi:hypothetical protein